MLSTHWTCLPIPPPPHTLLLGYTLLLILHSQAQRWWQVLTRALKRVYQTLLRIFAVFIGTWADRSLKTQRLVTCLSCHNSSVQSSLHAHFLYTAVPNYCIPLFRLVYRSPSQLHCPRPRICSHFQLFCTKKANLFWFCWHFTQYVWMCSLFLFF